VREFEHIRVLSDFGSPHHPIHHDTHGPNIVADDAIHLEWRPV
jgi:hypothetical protein